MSKRKGPGPRYILLATFCIVFSLSSLCAASTLKGMQIPRQSIVVCLEDAGFSFGTEKNGQDGVPSLEGKYADSIMQAFLKGPSDNLLSISVVTNMTRIDNRYPDENKKLAVLNDCLKKYSVLLGTVFSDETNWLEWLTQELDKVMQSPDKRTELKKNGLTVTFALFNRDNGGTALMLYIRKIERN